MKKRIIAFLIIIGLALKTVSVYAANNNSSDKTKAPNSTYAVH